VTHKVAAVIRPRCGIRRTALRIRTVSFVGFSLNPKDPPSAMSVGMHVPSSPGKIPRCCSWNGAATSGRARSLGSATATKGDSSPGPPDSCSGVPRSAIRGRPISCPSRRRFAGIRRTAVRAALRATPHTRNGVRSISNWTA
jgi:hypothetical protein